MTAEMDKQKPLLFSSLFKADIMLGFGALMVGVCALFVSLYEARVIRSQQQTAIWPYIVVGPDNVGEQFKITLRNHGTGPAIMRSARISYQGEYLSGWTDLRKYLKSTPYFAMPSNPLSGGVFPANSELAMVTIPNTDELSEAHRLFFRLDYDLCYCSLLEECWRVRGQFGANGAPPQERDRGACAPDPGNEFYQ